MSVNASGGSPVVHLQRYRTLPTTVIAQAQQQDRYLKRSELNELLSFFSSGQKLLKIAAILTQNANPIVSAGANRIFWGGNPMDYLEQPKELVDLPGFGKPVTVAGAVVARAAAVRDEARKLKEPRSIEPSRGFNFNPFGSLLEAIQGILESGSKAPLPGGFRRINISRYGPVRMKRSMRDLSWFLRYITYAIVAGNPSLLSVNVRGLRGVIPEDVTIATVVALREMQRKSLTYFEGDDEAANTVKQYFEVLINEYQAEKPTPRLRQGVSNEQQGLQVPHSYVLGEHPRPKFVMKPNLSATEKQAVLAAAYRQVFERDITRAYGVALTDLESKVKSGDISMKEFIRRLGQSRLYRRQFYEPFVVSRVVELAFRHFLGRGLSSLEEFQDYFEVISDRGLPALVDALVDSPEYADYFGEETVPYLRGLGQEAQECRNWGPQFNLFRYSAPVRKAPQFVTLFANYQKSQLNQHPYGSGNEPLEIQFGAIFSGETRNPATQPTPLGKDNRRLLIRCDSGSGNGRESAAHFGKAPSLSPRGLKLDHAAIANGRNMASGVSVNLSSHSAAAVIQGAYRQVFGRDVYAGQHLTVAETKLKNGEITVREFIRQLAQSRCFRSLYWENLYITKAIEYIHRRLLGRPTYGRAEMGQYYDICARKGFYALVEAMINSPEYLETFGEDTVPYERYITPRGFSMRSLREPVLWSSSQLNPPPTAGSAQYQVSSERNQTVSQMRFNLPATGSPQTQTAITPLNLQVAGSITAEED